MDLKEIERVVASIQNHLFQNSNAYAIGMLKSHFKGAGLQFKEHQVYTPGDDVRFIDWKLTARTSHTFVKTFEEERNVEITVVIDVTQSMFQGFRRISKMQAAIEITSLLYLLADKTADTVKTIILLDKVVTLPPASGHQGIALFVSFLEKAGLLLPDGRVKNNFEVINTVEETKKMALLKSFVARNKEVVFFSDFNDLSDFETLNKLIYRKNMHCFRVISPLDEAIKREYSIFGQRGGRVGNFRVKTRKDVDALQKGRWKEINVKQRYLETFVREML